MSAKSIKVTTDGSGNFSYSRAFRATITAIEVKLGDLSTPDIDVYDDTYENSFLSVDGVAADAVYFPGRYLQDDAGADLLADTGVKVGAAAVCVGVLTIDVAGGGDTKTGRIIIQYQN